VLRHGGLNVYTTLDPKLQAKAEEVIEKFVRSASPHTNVKQGALVSMDVETGHILAMVGGIDFEKNQFNTATQSRRAVGSTFKPFVYLTGIRLGVISPKTPISDRPVSFGGWSPHNWDGRYMGGMDVRRALTLSRNTPTVQVAAKVGIKEVIKTARLAGITSRIDSYLPSALGSSGVSPLELVTAYSTFARGGVFVQPTAIQQITDNRGRVIKMQTREPKRVFTQDHVAAVVDILIDVVEKGTGRNAQLPDRTVAGKTGTTDQIRDIWFMGFTPDMVCGVWFGDPANQPLHGVGSYNAAMAWHDYSTYYFETYKSQPRPFFLASDEYAARNGLVHLIDPVGVALAKKNLKNEKEDALALDAQTLEGDGSATGAGGSRRSSGNNGRAPTPSRGGTSAAASAQPRRINRPQQNSNYASPSQSGGSNESRQAKYDRWQNTLDDLLERN
ncbi:MAG: hypothetical protein KC476_07745, partial [Cyanobacteria bacterium HKST-UBA06]|nr:hypothetical protein [Cyanobacteria bacterium HKST-UBA06]